MIFYYLNTGKIFFLLCALCFVSIVSQAQEQRRIVRGSVRDAVGPLPGVSVVIEGTASGTVTDPEGEFSLEAGPEDRLVFTSIGFLSQTIVVGNQTVINVQLEEDLQQLS